MFIFKFVFDSKKQYSEYFLVSFKIMFIFKYILFKKKYRVL